VEPRLLAGTRFAHHTLLGGPPGSGAAGLNALVRWGILVLLAWLVTIIANQTRRLGASRE